MSVAIRFFIMSYARCHQVSMLMISPENSNGTVKNGAVVGYYSVSAAMSFSSH